MAKKTGLGADAIFGDAQKAKTPPEPQAESQKKSSISGLSSAADKLRTTIMLAPDVVVLLGRLREQAILEGSRQTQGEIIEEAIRTLARLKNINP